jgi:hypothetical protein
MIPGVTEWPAEDELLYAVKICFFIRSDRSSLYTRLIALATKCITRRICKVCVYKALALRIWRTHEIILHNHLLPCVMTMLKHTSLEAPLVTMVVIIVKHRRAV